MAQYIQADHRQWNLPWLPVLEGAQERFDEEFLAAEGVNVDTEEVLSFSTIKGQTVKISRSELMRIRFRTSPSMGEIQTDSRTQLSGFA